MIGRRSLTALLAATSLLAGAAPAQSLPLKRIGVKVGPAKLDGTQLSVGLKVRQRSRVKMIAVNGRDRRLFARGTYAKGRYVLKSGLPLRFIRPRLKLRVTARNLVTNKSGRRTLKIPVPAANAAPTAITLSSAAVAENAPVGTVVGTLAAVDPNTGDTHTFTVVSGPFTVVAGSLRTAASFDTESAPAQSVRVRATDAAGASFEQSFSVTISNVNEAPTSLALSPSAVDENQPAGTTVGTLSAQDPDMFDTKTFDLATGSGDTDNALFEVQGTLLKTKAPLDGTTPTRSVRLKVTDLGGLRAEAAFTVTVNPVNDAPVVTLSAADGAYTENAAAVPVDPGLTVADPDSAQLAGATVRVLSPVAGDELSFTNQGSITGSLSNNTLTLTGSASVADYQAALRTVAYRSTSDQPPAARSIEVTVTDGAATSAPRTRTIVVTAVNDAPSLTTTAAGLAYQEDDAATAVDPGVTVADADSTQLQSATVRISAGLASGQDELAFTDQNGITGGYDPGTGTLTLSGAASLATYQAALRAVTYRNTSQAPSTAVRTVSFIVTDAQSTASAAATRDIAVTAVPDAPTVATTAGALAYTENDAAIEADPGLIVADVDDATLASAQVTIASGFGAGDELLFSDQAGITGSFDALTGTLTLTGTASKEQYQVALRSVRYRSTSENPAAAKTIAFKVNDGTGDSNTAARAVTITAVNDAPAVSTSAGSASASGGGPAVAIDPGVSVSDPDSTQLQAARVRISANHLAAQDSLIFSNQNGISGAYDSGTGVLTLSGTASVADYQAALRSVTYANSSSTPNTATRTVEFRATDAQAADSNLATRNVTVAVPNVAPAVTTTVGSTPYTENAASVVVDAGVTVTDSDDVDLAGGVVSISAGRQTGDLLSFTNQNNIVGTYDAGTGRLSLTGTSTVANYQTALRSIRFSSTNDAPTAARTVSFAVNDGEAASNTATKQIAITAVDDPPTAVNDSATVAEDSAAAPVAVLGNDTDPDAGPKTITTASDPANGTVVLTGGAPGAHTGLTYQPDPNYCNAPPATTQDTFTYTVNGGSQATVSMTVTCVNDAPVADDEAVSGNDSAIGNTTMIFDDPSDAAPTLTPARPRTATTGDILAGDTDIDGPGPLTVTPGTFATNDGGSVTLEADGDFVYEPGPTSCTDASDFFDYTVEDSGSPEQTDVGRVTIAVAGCVWYVANNRAGNAGSSIAPFDTLAQAETASAANHTTFVFDGDNTTTGLTTGYALNAGERLIGEHEGLVVDPDGGGVLTPDTLLAANAGARPTLTATNEDVVDLDDGNEVRGFVVDPQGTGGGIAGATGDTGGGTLGDLIINDTGTAGTQPGLELDATTGTFTVSNLAVTTTGATGVRLNNAGTVDLEVVSITTSGAKALDAAGTNMATSTIATTTVTGSSSGGISLSGTSGTTTLGDGTGTDLALATTSGTGLALANAGTVDIAAAGIDDVSATAGPAVDIVNTSGTFAFDTVSSTSSSTDGINLDGLGASGFSATGGSITNAGVVGFDLNGGTGAVSYPGAITVNTSRPVDVTNRGAAATTTLSGTISDTGISTGINVATNNATSSVTFSGANSELDTATSPSVNAVTPGALAFTGGNLTLDSTTGTTFNATGAGTVSVSGTGNRLRATNGTALNVSGTTIGAADLNFVEIDADNPTASGIVLANTGSTGGLTVTGAGTACSSAVTCTGGAIQAADATGIALNNVSGGVSLTRVFVGGGLADGIAGTGVAGLTLDNALISGNGDATGESGVEFTELTGAVALTATTVTGSADRNVHVVNDSGTLNATVTGGRIASTSPTIGNDGILMNATGTGTMTLNVQNTTFEDNRDDHVQMTTDATNTATQALTVNNTTMNTTAAADPSVLGGGITFNPGGSATADVTLTNNNIQQAFASAIVIDTPGSNLDPQPAQIDAIVTGNTIGTAAVTDSGSESGDGITLNSNGLGDVDAVVSSNFIRQYANLAGLNVTQNDGNGTLDLTARGNTISDPGAFASNGIIVRSGLTGSTETGVTCLDIGHPSDPALKNTLTGAATGASNDIRVRHLGNTNVKLAGYGGTAYDVSAVTTYLLGRQTAGADGSASSSTTGLGFTNVASCTQP